MKPSLASRWLFCLLASAAIACSSSDDAPPDDTSPSADAGKDGDTDSGVVNDSGPDGDADADTPDSSSCEAKETLCSDACVNTQSDRANCGGCGNACESDEVCESGSCQLDCDSLTKCTPEGEAPHCADTQSDNANCGACGNPCESDEVCESGSCQLDCDPLARCTPDDDAPYCADTQSDNANCGACGNACESNEVCESGSCLLACAPLARCTPDDDAPYCAATETDNANCGACGNACESDHLCENGTCLLDCAPLARCTPDDDAPYCADTQSDNANCGACGNACAGDEECKAGVCLKTAIYDLTAANFTRAPFAGSDCEGGDAWWSKDYTGAPWGFSFTDSLPEGSVVVELSLELARTTHCNPGAGSWVFNGTHEGSLPKVGECYQCVAPMVVSTLDLSDGASVYSRGGHNSWIYNPSSFAFEGMRPNPAWSPGAFARVTVKYH